MRWIFFSAMTATAALAEPESVTQWAAALTETFNAQPGFMATYRSEGEGKSLDVTMALDTRSGLAFLRLQAVKEGRRMDWRFWTNESGELFADAMGRRLYCPSDTPELQALKELFPNSRNLTLVAVPGFLLASDSIEATCSWTGSPKPDWAEAAAGGNLGEVTPETVTFLTKQYGELTIDRKTGVLRHQSVTAPNGEKRVLELATFKSDPGKDPILDVSSKWELAGAETVLKPEIMEAARLKFFQQLVDGVDDGKMEQAALEKLLADGVPSLRRLARFAIQDHPDSILARIDWNAKLPGLKEGIRKIWLAQNPEGAGNDPTFDEYFNSEKVRESTVESLVKGMAAKGKADAEVKDTMFGKGKSLKSKTAAGQKAISDLNATLTRVAIEARLIPKMNELWGEPKKEE